jgi:hypothetical protein
MNALFVPACGGRAGAGRAGAGRVAWPAGWWRGYRLPSMTGIGAALQTLAGWLFVILQIAAVM